MNLGICGPVDCRALSAYLTASSDLPAGLGGSPVVALTRAALAEGWQVTVFSLDPSVQQEYVAQGNSGLRLCVGPFRSHHRARDLFAAEREYLATAIRRERPEIVHAHWTYEFALGALDSGLPTVVTAHDRPLQVLRWDHSPYRLARTWMARLVARRAARMTAVSSEVADHFKRWFGCRHTPAVIPNAVDEEWFTPNAGHQLGSTFASVLTGWGELKNGRTLVAAFGMVRRAIPGARLLLFGDGHGAGEQAEAWATAAGLHEGVAFIGHVPREVLRRRLAEAGVLVHPSREESFSMAIAEAMALSLPVIASRQGAGIADPAYAVLTDGNSATALAGEMLRLAADPVLRQRQAARACQFARECFWPSAVLARYAEVYRSL